MHDNCLFWQAISRTEQQQCRRLTFSSNNMRFEQNPTSNIDTLSEISGCTKQFFSCKRNFINYFLHNWRHSWIKEALSWVVFLLVYTEFSLGIPLMLWCLTTKYSKYSANGALHILACQQRQHEPRPYLSIWYDYGKYKICKHTSCFHMH